MQDETKIKIIFMICLTFIIITLLIALGWIFSPDAILTIKIDATDKGIEFIKSINYTNIN